MNRIYLGVDAGNSKTAVLACLGTGEVLGAGRSGCGDIYGAPTPAAAVEAVLAAVDEALLQAGIGTADLAGAALRLAGVDWPEDAEFWAAALSSRWPVALGRSILNDGYAAIRCGEPSGVGVAVIGGTAAAVAARGEDGSLWDMGWWGQHAMGATGLVQEALRAVCLAELGEAPTTRLTQTLPAFYGLGTVRELNHWFTRREAPATARERTRGARVVTRAAVAGDPVAVSIVREQGRRMAMYAGVAARKVGLSGQDRPVRVVLSGSVLADQDSPVATALLDQLAEFLPHAEAHRAVLPPVAGAALDALAEAGLQPDQDTVRRLVETTPDKYFATS